MGGLIYKAPGLGKAARKNLRVFPGRGEAAILRPFMGTHFQGVWLALQTFMASRAARNNQSCGTQQRELMLV